MGALDSLLSAVEHYFQSAVSSPAIAPSMSKVEQTELPPIYLQRTGHSLTIVGFERRSNGSCNLLVFDPTFDVGYFMKRYLKSDTACRRFRSVSPKVMLAPFRRGAKALRRFKAFETLSLTATAC